MCFRGPSINFEKKKFELLKFDDFFSKIAFQGTWRHFLGVEPKIEVA